jgi:hypothetical protein
MSSTDHRIEPAAAEDRKAVRVGRQAAGKVEAAGPPAGRRATFRVWRGDAAGGELHDYTTEVSEGMVVLDAIHQIQAE